MSPTLAAVLIVILVWWVGTGVVLRLQQSVLPDNVPATLSNVSVACISLCLLVLTGNNASAMGIFIAFISAVVLWGCIELSYYLGQIAGTHRVPCPKSAANWTRFKLALGTSIWHELLVLGLGFVLILSLSDATNTVGLYTYLVLWLMRWSAKLNLFLGVPNFSTLWIPQRLSYISSYIRTGTITPFYFISVLCASIVAFQLISKSSGLTVEQPLVYLIPAVLLILAIVEHLFMLVPFQELKMWNRVFNTKA